MTEAVAYYRVSTQKQGRSGLGLEAQRAAVLKIASERGLEVVQEFTEVESGKKKNRAELDAATEYARRTGATLLVAKLDRLTRNVAAGAAFLESGIPFVAADSPDASRMELQIRLVIAEQEAAFISERTRAALAARKARGLTMGNTSNLTPEARAKGPEAMKEAARQATRQATAFAQNLRTQGETLAAIAAILNESSFTTRTGAQWNAMQVKRILDRAIEQPAPTAAPQPTASKRKVAPPALVEKLQAMSADSPKVHPPKRRLAPEHLRSKREGEQ